MATFYSGWVATDDWRVVMDVSVSYPNDTQASVSVSVSTQNQYGNTTVNSSVSISCDGQTQSGTGGTNAGAGTHFQMSRTFTVSRGSGNRSVGVSAWVGFPGSGVAAYRTGATASGSVSIAGIPYRQPNPPSSPACSRVSDSQMDLTWQGNYTGTTGLYPWTGVYVDRIVDVGAWTQIATLSWSATNYSDRTTSANHQYRYALRSYGPGGTSSRVECSGGPLYTTPAAPSRVSVSVLSGTTVTVDVEGEAPYATSYDVQTRTGDGDWADAGSVTSFPATVSAGGGEVSVRVRATRGDLASAWTVSNTVTTITPPLAPSVSLGSASVVPTGTELTVTWVPNHPDASAQTQAQVEVTLDGTSQGSATVQGSATSYRLPSSYTSSPHVISVRVRTHGVDPDWGAWSSPVSVRVVTPTDAYLTNPATDGATVDGLPLDVTWVAEDETGIASQTLALLDSQGRELWSATLDPSARSQRVDEGTYQLANLTQYALRLTVHAGSTLVTVTSRTFRTDWAEPAPPVGTFSVGEGLSAVIEVREGTGEGDEPDAVSFSVTRVLADGTRWLVASGLTNHQRATDPLPPLNVPVTYEVTAYAETGVSSVTEVECVVPSTGTALSFGASAQEASFVLRLDPSSSRTVERAVELYDFADGGEGGGLPVAYTSPSLTAGGDEASTTLTPEEARELDALARRYPMVWVRDPLGMRAYCAASWRFSRLVPRGRVETTVTLTETRWREAW